MAETPFRPLLKWPGGKKREWRQIEPFLPARIRHFVDPFMGGCAPFGLAKFEGRAFLNDKHVRLVDLHVRVQRGDPSLFRELVDLGEAWETLAKVAKSRRHEFLRLVAAARRDEVVRTDPADPFLASLEDKAARLARLEVRHDMTFDADALIEHCETAIRAAFYTRIRAEERTATGARATACFLFVRDYCYGSMFRNNAAGEFNIPYGGRSYNRKSFLARAEQLRSPATRQRLARAEFFALDFDEFLAVRRELSSEDLVFVDPPYDSEFSTYGGNSFGIAEHARLAEALQRLPARWLLVIKETPEIHRLYAESLKRGSFGKTYGYNVRGRNDRAARHLVIANYEARAPAVVR